MPDARFYEDLGPVSLADLAALTGSSFAGGELAIRTAAPLARADEGAVAFLSDRRYAAELAGTKAGACFVSADFAGQVPEGCVALVTRLPQAAWAAAAAALHRPRTHDGAEAVHPTAELEESVLVAAGAVVGPGAKVGRGTSIGPNAVIGPGVAIGRDCRIGPGAYVGFALVGDGVQIMANAVVGEAGFGATGGAGGVVDIPQLGRVILQDNVTVGAGTCIDRGAWDDTVVGENTKIDNLVQIAHNVRIGRNCVMASQTGISGSTVVGDGVAFGGRAGVADHLTIGAGARLAAGSGAMKDVPPGETWGGVPARPLRQWMRESAWLIRNAARKGNRDE